MPRVSVNGITISYERYGDGEPVLLIMGSSAAGQVWTTHQTPALTAAGYHCVIFNNRGVPPSDAPPGRYSLSCMVTDTERLIEALDLGRCHVVGTSLGALIAQELALARPDVVRSLVLIGTKAREDAVRRSLITSERTLKESGVRVPPAYEAAMTAVQMLSPTTLNDDREASTWLDLFELSAQMNERADGQSWADLIGDRRAALRTITAPCRVIAYADDLINPPHLAAEVCDAIPDCDLVELPRCGHLGFLEQPEQTNDAILEFLNRH